MTVVPFTGDTTADMPPEKVLSGAIEDGIDPAIVIGLDGDGRIYVASSLGNSDTVLGLLYRATAWLAEQANAL
jgi:hypothetical protein